MSNSSALQSFKLAQLAKVVMDEPWDTSLTWSDAEEALPSLTVFERNAAAQQVLLELFDEGLVGFFRVADFGHDYSRAPKSEELLSRAELVGLLGGGRESPVPFLGMRATERGREVYFARNPNERSRWERGQP